MVFVSGMVLVMQIYKRFAVKMVMRMIRWTDSLPIWKTICWLHTHPIIMIHCWTTLKIRKMVHMKQLTLGQPSMKFAVRCIVLGGRSWREMYFSHLMNPISRRKNLPLTLALISIPPCKLEMTPKRFLWPQRNRYSFRPNPRRHSGTFPNRTMAAIFSCSQKDDTI